MAYIEQYTVLQGDVKHTKTLQEVLGMFDWSPEEVDKIAKLGRFESVTIDQIKITHEYAPPKSGTIYLREKADSPLHVNWIDQGQFSADNSNPRYFSFTLGSPAYYGETPEEQLYTVAQTILKQLKIGNPDGL